MPISGEPNICILYIKYFNLAFAAVWCKKAGVYMIYTSSERDGHLVLPVSCLHTGE